MSGRGGTIAPQKDEEGTTHLEHHVEDVGVGLLDLIEQHHGVRPPAHRLCQLSALVVADVACDIGKRVRAGTTALGCRVTVG